MISMRKYKGSLQHKISKKINLKKGGGSSALNNF